MESLLEQFMNSLKPGGDAPSEALVEALGRECPAFTLPAVERLRRAGCTQSERERLTAMVALNAPDPATLYSLVGPDATAEPFYPPEQEPPTPSTTSAIDTFLETYGHAPTAKEDALLEELILNPQPDYAAMLEAEYADEPPAPAPSDAQSALIDAFLSKPVAEQFPHLKQSEPEPEAEGEGRAASAETTAACEAAREPEPTPRDAARPAPKAAPDPDSSLSESLAKIYIRQGKYDKAYEIITGLNLNFPEKSVYFADQLRFLQKLMLNRKYQ